jgi:AraC-like DNA-binding protein
MEENNDIRQHMSDSEKVSWLAACGWTEEDIAKSLGMSHRAFMGRVEDPADVFITIEQPKLIRNIRV